MIPAMTAGSPALPVVSGTGSLRARVCCRRRCFFCLQAGARAARGPLARRAAADRPTEAFVLELPCAVIARTSESGGGVSDARSPGLPGFRTRDGLRRAGAEGAARPDGEDSRRCPRRRGFGQARPDRRRAQSLPGVCGLGQPNRPAGGRLRRRHAFLAGRAAGGWPRHTHVCLRPRGHGQQRCAGGRA
jgi:hypothetical protein